MHVLVLVCVHRWRRSPCSPSSPGHSERRRNPVLSYRGERGRLVCSSTSSPRQSMTPQDEQAGRARCSAALAGVKHYLSSNSCLLEAFPEINRVARLFSFLFWFIYFYFKGCFLPSVLALLSVKQAGLGMVPGSRL